MTDEFTTYLDEDLLENIATEDLNIDNVSLFKLISKGNPGAVSILIALNDTCEDHVLDVFLEKVMTYNIFGSRLWYLYKNECARNLTTLLNLDLSSFTDAYFYEKFEKYIQAQ